MKTKSIYSVILFLSMAIFLVFSASAESQTNEVLLSYGVSESYIINIPSSIEITSSTDTGTFDVDLTNIKVGPGRTINVSISSENTENNSETFYLTNSYNSEITTPYVLSIKDGIVLSNGSNFIVADGTNSSILETITAWLPTPPTIPGDYTDTLTFTTYVDETGGAGFYRSDLLIGTVETLGLDISGATTGPGWGENNPNSPSNIIMNYGISKIIFNENLPNINSVYFAFENSRGLQEVIFRNTVTKIGYGMFSGCEELTNVTLSDNISDIIYGTFAHTSIEHIIMPKHLKYLGDYVFDGSPLKTIVIYDEVEGFGYDVFANTQLETIYYTGTEEEWNSIPVFNNELGIPEGCEIVFNYIPN